MGRKKKSRFAASRETLAINRLRTPDGKDQFISIDSGISKRTPRSFGMRIRYVFSPVFLEQRCSPAFVVSVLKMLNKKADNKPWETDNRM